MASLNSISWEQVKGAWNGLAQKHGLRKINKLSEPRKKHYLKRVEEDSAQYFWNALARELPFLSDHMQRYCTFDFCVRPSGFLKLDEGNYREPDRVRAKIQTDNAKRNVALANRQNEIEKEACSEEQAKKHLDRMLKRFNQRSREVGEA